ncbi:putative ATP-grasp-modified RiPP [Streptomyces sp. NPDC049906]|uniref:putative ATP-grasp-modified RiPP n=1 Tax=Streptomyces sp. NPDC049906 TaxID=3155656 RepID=UPI0034266019
MTFTAERAVPPALRPIRTTPIRPFGLTRAVPVALPDTTKVSPLLTLCPDRQISVTADGTPFIHEPSMGTALTTVQETREDHQPDTSIENDTD